MPVITIQHQTSIKILKQQQLFLCSVRKTLGGHAVGMHSVETAPERNQSLLQSRQKLVSILEIEVRAHKYALRLFIISLIYFILF